MAEPAWSSPTHAGLRALALDVPVWSQDKDFSTTGLQVMTTGDLLEALGL